MISTLPFSLLFFACWKLSIPWQPTGCKQVHLSHSIVRTALHSALTLHAWLKVKIALHSKRAVPSLAPCLTPSHTEHAARLLHLFLLFLVVYHREGWSTTPCAVLNLKANWMKLVLKNIQRCLNHVYLLEQLKITRMGKTSRKNNSSKMRWAMLRTGKQKDRGVIQSFRSLSGWPSIQTGRYHFQIARLRWTSSRRSIGLIPKWKWEMLTNCSKFHNRSVQTFWIRLPRHKWPESWSSMEDPVVPLERNMYGHPLAGLLWERQFEKLLLKLWLGEGFQLGMSLCTSWKRIILIRVCGWHKIVENIDPMWKVLNKEVD